jgi:hypothetical protein
MECVATGKREDILYFFRLRFKYEGYDAKTVAVVSKLPPTVSRPVFLGVEISFEAHNQNISSSSFDLNVFYTRMGSPF